MRQWEIDFEADLAIREIQNKKAREAFRLAQLTTRKSSTRGYLFFSVIIGIQIIIWVTIGYMICQLLR